MTLLIPPRLRTMCAAFALTAYASPLVVGLAAQLGHGAEHLIEVVQILERRAAAMGVTHLHDAPEGRDRGTFVHAHGGAPHTHDAGVGVLLVAVEEADERADQAGITAPVELSSHMPSRGALASFAALDGAVASAEPRAARSGNLLPPPLPPPRA